MQETQISTELSTFFTKCPRLMEILEELQSNDEADDNVFFTILELLVKTGQQRLAKEFLQPYFDDEEAEKQIAEIENTDTLNIIDCYNLGCSNHFIKKCHGKVKENVNGEITNTPLKILAGKGKGNIVRDNETGFIYEDGILKDVNFNIFSRYVHSKIKVKIKAKDIYYRYTNKKYWEQEKEEKIKKTIRTIFNDIEKDSWRKKYGAECFEHFDMDCKETPTNNFNYINLMNGLYNIETKELCKHNSKIFTTSQLPIEYDQNADCPIFKKFIDDVFGAKDIQLKNLVQEIAGYCLTTTTRAEKFFIFHGAGGNGKSILCTIFSEILGKENVSAIQMGDFRDDFKRAHIVDKLANIATENEVRYLETAYSKSIASGDPILINEKFVPPYNYTPFTKLIFSLNNMPYSADKSNGLERKLIIIPFKYSFVDNAVRKDQKKRDRAIIDRLRTEKSGILNWFIEGLERLKQNGYKFTESKTANEALNEYMRSVNVVLDFVNETIKEAEGKRLSTTQLQSAFSAWCDAEGHKKAKEMGKRKFLKELRTALEKESMSYYESKSDSKYYFHGIKFKDGDRQLNMISNHYD